MPAARCSLCDINLPADKHLCPACKRPTWKLESKTDTHDTDWEEAVDRIRKRVTLAWNDFIPNVNCEVICKDGELFVHYTHLRDMGYLDIESGSIVKVNDDYYEVYGAVYPGTDALGWWIRVIETEGVFDNATSSDIDRECAAQTA